MTTPVRFLDLRGEWDSLGDAAPRAFEQTLRGGRYVLGPEVAAFEQEFARVCGARFCVGVGSGFDALALTLRAWGIGPGDEVLVPALTATATWMAVAAVGATPVAVDVTRDTLTMDPVHLASLVTDRARAVIPVHLYGNPADLSAITDVAARHGLRLLQDAAQAHGATWGGDPIARQGNAVAFSFYPTKNLGALGDGGAVVTDDPRLAEIIRSSRQYGWRERDLPERVGANSRLDEVQAALLRVKLPHLQEWNDTRRNLAERYREALAGIPSLRLQGPHAQAGRVWHLFVVRVSDRDALRRSLADEGVETMIHYPVSAAEPSLRSVIGMRCADVPVAQRAATEVLSLPLYPRLPPAAQTRVIQTVRRLLNPG